MHVAKYALMYIEYPVEIQTPAYWNLIAHNMAASPTLLSPSSILLQLLLRFLSGKE